MTMTNDLDPSNRFAAALGASQPGGDAQHMSRPSQDFSSRPDGRPPVFSDRSLRQLGVFFAGAGFLTLATLVTRRSVARKHLATIPRFYTPSNRSCLKLDSDSSLIAVEALFLATLNVTGFGIMMTGGLTWALDVSGFDDLRTMARRKLGGDKGGTDEDAEREVEEWVAKILGRKEEGEAQAKQKTNQSESSVSAAKN